ncbi:TFIIB-domain-containing protein [Hypoxylon fragiforme]|uniref:TFIIB-domain-containing protein n=1 Tax=Hypoxylon fragiforme TaxID=63214 RepID=UPI0020C6EEA7|nr:TFIIB-domain-containing protein [Hypoxylon fragiforme]KAI2609483.1 TFIIB-domain-containing protein [Hypoxylon fragiforme]
MATVVPRPDIDLSSQMLPPPPVSAPSAAAAPTADEEYKQNLNSRLTCPDCNENPPNLVEEFSSGDMVCASCGLVLGDRIIDTRSEWRTFANDDQGNDDPSRVGDAMNPLLSGSQLETNIAFGEGMRSRELHRAQNRSVNDKATKTLLSAYREISNLCEAISIPKTTQDTAKHIFKLVEEAKLFKSKPIESVIASCIFIACRQSKAPRTFREIFSLTKVSKKEIGRTFKQLEKFLQSNREANTNGSFLMVENYEATGTTGASELCARYCNNLQFKNPHLMERVSKSLAEKSSALKDLAGRSPLSIAAAAIYMASHLMGDARTSRDIAAVAGVSDGTIRTAYRHMYPARDDLVEKEWLSQKGGGRIDRLPQS